MKRGLVWMVNTENPLHLLIWLVWTIIVNILALLKLIDLMNGIKP